MINTRLSQTASNFQPLHRSDLCLQQALVKVDKWLVLNLSVTPIANSVFLRVLLTKLNFVETTFFTHRDATFVTIVVSSCKNFEVSHFAKRALAQSTLIVSAFGHLI